MTQGAVDQFHHRLEAKEDDQIFASSAPEYQKSMTLETNRAFLSRLRRKLGELRSSQPANIQVNHTPNGTWVTAVYRSQFEKGDAQETFTWSVRAGQAHLAGYAVNSPLLLTD
jgi:hypothetical protein